MEFKLDTTIYEPVELEAMKKLIAKLDANKVNPTKWVDYQKRKDKFLIRFLMANKFDVEKTYDQFTKFLAWREENKVDNVLWEKENDPMLKTVYDLWPVTCHKTDKLGLPVLYEKIGPADVKGLFMAYPDINYWIRNHILMHEETNHVIFTKHEKALEGRYQGIIFVEDLAGLSWQHWYGPAINVMKAVSEIDTKYYPNAVRKLCVINAPGIFTWMWRLVKPWMDPATANSLVILGANYYEILSQEIPPENFPKEYGGQCDCEGGCLKKCGKFIATGADDTMHTNVAARSDLKVPFIVEEGSVLKWEFTTKDNDISFGLEYESEDGKQSALLPVTRHNSHQQKSTGSFTALQSGNYILHWDNTYSYFKGKDLSYKITVDTPSSKPNS